jgi:hypothetical protein
VLRVVSSTAENPARAERAVKPAPGRLGEQTAGVWTRVQACQVMTEGSVDTLLRNGTWQVVWPGVHADGGFALSAEQLGHAAVLTGGGGSGAVAAGRCAARIWELPLIDDDDPATGARDWLHTDVSVRLPMPDLAHGGRVLHRHQFRFAAGDLVRRPSGLWTTSALRTLIDCRLLLTHEALVCAVDAALHQGVVTRKGLERSVDRLKGWRGAPAFRAAVDAADGRAESPGETLTRLVLLPVLPDLVPQVEVFDHAARPVARFDLADEEIRLAVEFDGRAGHEGGLMVAKDRKRDRRTDGLGWVTERTTWFEVRRQQSALRRRVLSVADTRKRAGG